MSHLSCDPLLPLIINSTRLSQIRICKSKIIIWVCSTLSFCSNISHSQFLLMYSTLPLRWKYGWTFRKTNNNDNICSILQPNRTPIASLVTTGSSIIGKLLIAIMLASTLRRNYFAEFATIDSSQRASWPHTATF